MSTINVGDVVLGYVAVEGALDERQRCTYRQAILAAVAMDGGHYVAPSTCDRMIDDLDEIISESHSVEEGTVEENTRQLACVKQALALLCQSLIVSMKPIEGDAKVADRQARLSVIVDHLEKLKEEWSCP